MKIDETSFKERLTRIKKEVDDGSFNIANHNGVYKDVEGGKPIVVEIRQEDLDNKSINVYQTALIELLLEENILRKE